MPHCKHCLCTEQHASPVSYQGLIQPCWWVIDPDPITGAGVCSNPECVKKEYDLRKDQGWPTVEESLCSA